MNRSQIEDTRYKLVFETRPDYLYVYIEIYVVSYEVMKQYCVDIAEAVGRISAASLLVEKAASEQLSTTDAFRLASELPAMGLAGIKIAFVDHTKDNEKLNEFTEMVGHNRGLNTRTFEDVRAAEEWLLSA